MIKVLITGITGFAGSYLSDYLLKQNKFEVSGTYLNDFNLPNLDNKDSLKLHKLNLMDADSTRRLIEDEKPDYLFHLAALPSAKKSYSNPGETFINNVLSEINLLEAIR